MLFDTHAHLNDVQFDNDREQLLSDIRNMGHYVEIGTDIESSIAAADLADRYDFVYAAAGIYPHCTADITLEDIDSLREICRRQKVVAIGEIGLDYHYDDTAPEIQRKWFDIQLDLCAELDLPVAIHTRDAMRDTIDILRRHSDVNGIIHCYSGSAESAKILLDMGYYISFAGPVTFKKSRKLAEAAAVVPIDRLLIETDSPYLAPDPHRGHRNNPLLVECVARRIAEIKEMSFEEVARKTYDNAMRAYRIK